jgi:hypothetical protein
MLSKSNQSTDKRECGCDKCKLNGWTTVTRKTYARHKAAREQSGFSAEFRRFLRDSSSSAQVPDSVPATLTVPLIVSRSEASRPPITDEDLVADISMMSLNDREVEDENDVDGDDENENDKGEGDGDLSMYVGEKVRSVPSCRVPIHPIITLLAAG